MIALLRFLFFSATASILFLFSISYLGNFHWLFDIFTHFRLQYLFFISVLMVISLAIRRYWMSALLSVAFIIIGLEILPYYFPWKQDATSKTAFTIACANLLNSNGDFQAVHDFTQEANADILILQEITTLWTIALDTTLSQYPYRLEIPREDNFGLAVYSRVPVEKMVRIGLNDIGIPSIAIRLKIDSTDLTILTTHPLPPTGKTDAEARNHQLSQISKYRKTCTGEFILMGDLNTSSFSSHFKQLLYSTNLSDSRMGYGLLPTWPTWFPPLMITLDHCLVSEGIAVTHRSTGRKTGSDHLPIVLSFSMK